jgi:hypothetical protein
MMIEKKCEGENSTGMIERDTEGKWIYVARAIKRECVETYKERGERWKWRERRREEHCKGKTYKMYHQVKGCR